jgi:imidazolonepropionase-like amidohydrolase
MDAVVSATLGAAKAVWLDDQVGSVAPGKMADFVIVDGDPLTDISLLVSGIVGVVQGGRVVRDDLGILADLRRVAVERNGTRTAVAVG